MIVVVSYNRGCFSLVKGGTPLLPPAVMMPLLPPVIMRFEVTF